MLLVSDKPTAESAVRLDLQSIAQEQPKFPANIGPLVFPLLQRIWKEGPSLQYSGTSIIRTPLGPYQAVLIIEVSLVGRLCKPHPHNPRGSFASLKYSRQQRRSKEGLIGSDIAIFDILVW